MGLKELMNMIYNFMTLGNIPSLIFVFQKNLFSYAMTYNKLIRYTFVNKDETFFFFSLPVPAKIWPLQLALLWTWWFIATGLQLVILVIVLICSLFPNCLYFVSPCCTMTLSVLLAALLISCLFHKIVVSYSTQCVTRPPTKLMMAKHLEETDDFYDSYRIIVMTLIEYLWLL